MNLCRTGVSLLASLYAALLLPNPALAQVPHTFNNGEVADAEKMNQNFEAIDQVGPTVTFGPFYDQIIGVSSKIDIEMQDESGVIYWRTVYGLQTSYPQLSSLQFLRGAPTISSISQTIGLGPNANYDFVIIAEDMRGNKTIAEQTFTGPTTNIKQGLYRADPPLTWPTSFCDGQEEELEYLQVYLSVPQDSAWPTVGLGMTLCESVGYITPSSPEVCDGFYYYSIFTDQQLIGPSTLQVVGANSFDGTSQLLFSTDSSEVEVTYSGSMDCSYLGSGFGVVALGPHQATFYRVDQRLNEKRE